MEARRNAGDVERAPSADDDEVVARLEGDWAADVAAYERIIVTRWKWRTTLCRRGRAIPRTVPVALRCAWRSQEERRPTRSSMAPPAARRGRVFEQALADRLSRDPRDDLHAISGCGARLLSRIRRPDPGSIRQKPGMMVAAAPIVEEMERIAVAEEVRLDEESRRWLDNLRADGATAGRCDRPAARPAAARGSLRGRAPAPDAAAPARRRARRHRASRPPTTR